jgi:hypothetical protein
MSAGQMGVISLDKQIFSDRCEAKALNRKRFFLPKPAGMVFLFYLY